MEGLEESIPAYLFRDPEYSLYIPHDGWQYHRMQHLQELVRPTLTGLYRITAEEADLYFRSLWLVCHSLSTLIVTGDCPYSDREIGRMLTQFSVSICKSIKEIPGFAAGGFDRGAVFRGLIGG